MYAQTTEAVLQAGPQHACAGATERAFCKGRRPSEKSFRRPTCHAYDYAALIVPTAVCICIGMHAVKRRNRTHEIHNLHKTHRPRSLKCPKMRRQEPEPEHKLSCLSILAKANMLKQLKLCFSRAPACAGATERAFCKGRRPSEKEFQTAYVPCVRLRCANRTYGGLYLHSMHAVKRRNRTHEIHNLHKTHRPILKMRRCSRQFEAQLSCLSILAKANMLKQLKLCFRPGSCLRRSDGKGILQRSQAV